MNESVLALVLPPLLLVPAMGLLSRLDGRHALAAELKRKGLHVGVGLASLAFPLILDSEARILGALALVVLWMLAVRRIPALRRRFGRCLFDSRRTAPGEVYFSLAVASLLLVPGHPLLYTIPVLVLTLADAAAAIAGRLVPAHRRRVLYGEKTVAGSLAFLIVAFIVSWLPLALGPLSAAAAAAAAVCVAVVTAATEAVSRRGLDNLFVPAGAWLTLQASGALPAAV